MPLTELLRLSKGKMDATQQKATNSNDPPCRQQDSECVELVWENGQIMMQGQSSRPPRKTPLSNNTQTCVHKPEDLRNVNGLKMAKDSVMTDLPLPVSSNDVGLDQDIDMMSWLNYPMEDPMHNDYTSDFLRELSGVAINDVSVSRERKSSLQGDGHRQGNLDKGPSICEKHTSGASSELVQFSQPFQHVAPRSDLCNASGNATSACNNVTSIDSVCNASSLCTFTSMRLQRLHTAHPSTSSGVTNFSCFARPNPNGRANPVGVNSLNIMEIDGKRGMLSSCNNTDSTIVRFTIGSQNEKSTQNQSVVATVNESPGSLPTKLAEEFLSLDQTASHEDNARIDTSPNQTCGKTTTNAAIVSESNMENVVTPSVCSGNSVEKASSQPARDLKRKSQEAGESDGPSEELGESEGAKKAPPARSGSKRSRAAEVHNLSERRRRDRINEKMRALQELIPNCNKVDKASMLDEAIDYLKSLQLQVQMLTMGMYIHPMMLPPRMQSNTQGAQMPQFSHMGAGMGVGGMGMGMGCGMNMLDMNSNMKMVPFRGTHYPVHAGNAFQGMPGSNIQAFGHHSQGLPMPIQRSPVHPVSGAPGALNIPLGPNVLSMAGPHVAQLAPSTNSRDVGIRVMPGHYVNAPTAQVSIQCQATNMAIERPDAPHDQPHVLNASEVAIPTSASDSIPSCD